MSVTMRPLSWDDFSAFYELYGLEHMETYGGFTMPPEEVRAEWEMPTFNPLTDLMGLFKDEDLIGYAEVRYWRNPPIRPTVYGFVHPDYREKGYGTRLVQWAIERSKQFFDAVPQEARVVLQSFTSHREGQQLFEDFGFQNARESWLMHINFTETPPSPTFPDGMRIMSMAEGVTVEDIARLHYETFRDHRGSQEEPLDEVIARWHRIIEGVPDFDPALYAIVKDGDANVAIITVDPTASDDLDKGVVSVLGVMPAYRRRSIGLQLLYFAFDALYKRGKTSCELSVDASSLTGATRLYERAGMQKVKTFYAYELELRDGSELSNQG